MSDCTTRALRIALLAMVGALVFEAAKQSVIPNISIWESHLLTILFITASTFVVSTVMLRREAKSRSVLESHHRDISHLRLLLEQSRDGMCVIDQGYRVVETNKTLADMLGYTAEEMRQLYVWDLEAQFTPEQFSATFPPLTESQVFETQHRRKDGTLYDAEVSVNIADCGGRTLAFAVIRDISARKAAESALRESEELYRMLFARNPYPMWICDVDTLAFLEVNDAAVAHYGYSHDEFLKMTVKDIRPPEDVPGLLARLSKAKSGYVFSSNTRHQQRDGTIIYVDVAVYRFIQRGKLVTLTLANDVTERNRAEEAIRRSEAELRSFVEKSPFGIFRSSIEEDRFLSVNPALVKMLGYASVEELLSTKLSIDVYVNSQDCRKVLTPLLRDGGFDDIEVQCRRKDGKIITVRSSGRPVQESFTGTFDGIVEDVTEREFAEQALRESEGYFRSLFENMSEGYAYCRMLFDDCGRPEDFVYLDVNDAFGGLTGLKDVVGRKVTEVIPDIRESQPELFEAYARVAATGRPERFEFELKSMAMWFSISAYSPERGYFVAVFDVVTERKRAEQALRESEERFRQVVESSPVGMFIQTDGIHRYFNPAALAMFGAESASQVVGRGYLEVIHPDCRADVIERARIVREEKKAVPFLEQRLLRVDGTVFEGEITAVPFIFEGHGGALVFVRDITGRKREEADRRALEQQLRQAQKMEAVGRLAGGIAHDFNNLLMVIQSYSEMLQDSLPAHSALRKNTREIMKAAERAASLTGQMLAFSRKQIISPVVLDLNAVINETAKMLKRIIGEDIEFRVDPAESLWAIEADSDQIVQVLMNLCVNARDAMPQGGTLTITTGNITVEEVRSGGRTYMSPGNYVKVSVTDTGIGIIKDIQGDIFEPFFTTKEVGKGTGLGLAMVYGIVKQSGGYVWVDSEVGKGACFTIYLPRANGATPPYMPVKAEALPRGTEILLVAEDEEALREAICDYLRSLGYTVLAANSGQQALLAASECEGHIDLLITDVVMPRMSGRELSQMLESLRPDLKTIYMSGYTDDAVLRHGIHEQGATFLQKPFSLGALARKVRDTLGRTETATDRST